MNENRTPPAGTEATAPGDETRVKDMTLPAQAFTRYFRDRALRTLRLLTVFTEADMALRPGEGSRSTAELVEHIRQIHNFIRGLLEDENPSLDLFRREFPIKTSEEAIVLLAESIIDVTRAAQAINAAQWDQVIAPFGPGMPMTRRSLVYLMIEHEIHHCGQMHVYARMCGKQPPNLYDPTDESMLATGAGE